jgi:hypothetical protein
MEVLGRRGIAPTLLDLDTRWGEWSASLPGSALPLGKGPPVLTGLSGPQSRYGHRGYKKSPFLLPGIEPRSPGRPVRNQTLHWLSYPSSAIFCIISIFIYVLMQQTACQSEQVQQRREKKTEHPKSFKLVRKFCEGVYTFAHCKRTGTRSTRTLTGTSAEQRNVTCVPSGDWSTDCFKKSKTKLYNC